MLRLGTEGVQDFSQGRKQSLVFGRSSWSDFGKRFALLGAGFVFVANGFEKITSHCVDDFASEVRGFLPTFRGVFGDAADIFIHVAARIIHQNIHEYGTDFRQNTA